MSALIGRPPAVTHDINPYIPDILRPTPISSFQHRHLDAASPSSHNALISLDNNLLNTRTSDCVRLPSQRLHQSESHSSNTLTTTCPIPSHPLCVRCHELIKDHYLYRIRGQTWHETCAICFTCSAALSDVCFLHEGQLYCRRDYDRLHATKCTNCCQPMRSHELFMRARHPNATGDGDPSSLIFHVSCFSCAVCQQPLAAGDQYVIDTVTHRPICRADFLTAQQRTSSSPGIQRLPLNSSFECAVRPESASLTTSEPPNAPTGFGGRRMRTSLTEEQRLHLQKAYELNSRPSKNVREFLAKELSVPVRVVQVWFQNQRARDKRGLVQRRRSGRPHPTHTVNTNRHVHSSHSASPTTAMTPSPRTSVESGPLLDFHEYSGETHDLRSTVNESNTRPWMPAADSVWFSGPDSQLDASPRCPRS